MLHWEIKDRGNKNKVTNERTNHILGTLVRLTYGHSKHLWFVDYFICCSFPYVRRLHYGNQRTEKALYRLAETCYIFACQPDTSDFSQRALPYTLLPGITNALHLSSDMLRCKSSPGRQWCAGITTRVQYVIPGRYTPTYINCPICNVRVESMLWWVGWGQVHQR